MKVKSRISIAIVLGALAVLAGCKKEAQNNSTAQESIAAIHQREGIPVRVDSIKMMKLNKVRKYSGSLEGVRQKSVYAAAPEYVKSVKVRIGDWVRKGQVVAELEKNGVTPQYRQTQAQYEVVKKTYERLKKVFEKGGISRQQLDEAEAQMKAVGAQFDAMSKVMHLEAPLSGVVTDIYTKAGMVAISGRDEHPFMMISRIDRMILRIPISTQEINNFKVGLLANIELNGKVFNGKVTKVPLAANVMNRMFYVEITFQNKERLLRPGMFARASVILDSQTGLAVPHHAVIRKNGEDYIYVVTKGQAIPVRVTRELESDDYVIVSGSLQDGEQIVVDGYNKLGPKPVKVKVVE